MPCLWATLQVQHREPSMHWAFAAQFVMMRPCWLQDLMPQYEKHHDLWLSRKLQPRYGSLLSILASVTQESRAPCRACLSVRTAALKACPPEALRVNAGVLFEQGKLDGAIATYREALAHEPNFPEAYNNLGNALREAGRVDEAIQCYTLCIQLQMGR